MIDVPSLISELRENLGGLDSTDLPDDAALLLLNRSYWELIDKFKFREKEVTVTFPTVAGTRLYGVPNPFDALRQLSIEDINTFAHTTLERMTEFEYENTFVNTTVDRGKPTHYIRAAGGVYLWPTPDLIYTITMKYWTVLGDLVNQSGTLPQLPQIWHEIILFGGTWRGFIKFGDYARSQAAKVHADGLTQQYQATLTASKEESDTHRGGVDVIGYDDVYTNTFNKSNTTRQRDWP